MKTHAPSRMPVTRMVLFEIFSSTKQSFRGLGYDAASGGTG